MATVQLVLKRGLAGGGGRCRVSAALFFFQTRNSIIVVALLLKAIGGGVYLRQHSLVLAIKKKVPPHHACIYRLYIPFTTLQLRIHAPKAILLLEGAAQVWHGGLFPSCRRKGQTGGRLLVA